MIVLVGVVGGIVFGILPGVYRRIANNPLRDPNAFRMMSWKLFLPQALEISKDWRDDAILYNISISVLPQDSTDLNDIRFSFDSEYEPVWLSVKITEGKGNVEVELFEGDYQDLIARGLPAPHRLNINIEGILSDSREAFTILHNNGGNDFMSKYGDKGYRVSLYLQSQTVLKTRWRALYGTWEQPGPAWNIIMDAISNKLLNPNIYGEK